MPEDTRAVVRPGRYRLGIDVGGTFTDLLVMEEATGAIRALKTPSTVDPEDAIINGIEALEARFGIRPQDIVYFSHGTTLTVNTLLQRNGDPVGLLVTQGFRDILELRRLRLSKANDFFVPKPVPLVPRRHVKEIAERVLGDGRVLIPLRSEEVEARAKELMAEGIRNIAICFLHAHRNDAHEREALACIEAALPDVYVCASSNIWPQQREYERALVSVINAYIGGRMKRYFATLQRRVREAGMGCRVFSTKSNGGVMSLEAAAERPVQTLLSGPACGVIGAAHIGRLIGDNRLVTLDMGGTSVDIAVVRSEVTYASDNTVGDFPVIMPAVDVSAIGAGGGSIAWTDAEGVLKVGPQSAGAVPGPACYGRGGTKPTVTDAYVTVGICNPGNFLGGEMALDPAKARAAIDTVGKPLGMGTVEAADAMLQIATANIYAGLIPQMARRGADPAEFSLLAFGSAGPTQVFMLARELPMRRVIIPPTPGTLCALGCLVADLRADFVASIWRDTADLDDEEVQALYARLEGEAAAWLAAEKVDLTHSYMLRSADICYVGQSFELNVPFPSAGTLTTAEVVSWFHDRYERVYGYADRKAPARLLEARVQVVGVMPKPEIRPAAAPPQVNPGPAERTVFDRGGWVTVAVHQRSTLKTGDTLHGPLLIEQYDTTCWVPEGFRVTVDPWANLIGERAT
ncbi:MAG: hydantoinase/oxoprolinase family protein [Rhodospirillales bacterium]|nr:hydantoinase/oxoprolinase family protein [Rhodospirillales bacterium]